MDDKETAGSGWLGWVGFAGFMMLLGGFLSGLAGVVALFKDTVVYQATTGNAWVFSYNQWGWIHIALGALAIIAALSLFSGKMFGRIFAVIIALISAAANMAFIPVYPLWSLLVITIDVLVIYAVIAHAGNLKE